MSMDYAHKLQPVRGDRTIFAGAVQAIDTDMSMAIGPSDKKVERKRNLRRTCGISANSLRLYLRNATMASMY